MEEGRKEEGERGNEIGGEREERVEEIKTYGYNSKGGKLKLLFPILGVLIILVIGAIVFLLLRNKSVGISDEKLINGTSVILGENSQIKFNVDEQEHKISVISVENSTVKITIQSNPINATLTIGDTKKIDFDNNGTYDFSVKLINIANGKADLYIKKISEVICEQDWSCTDWGKCTDDSQTRNCTDANDCESEDEKPIEVQVCVSPPSCSELSGDLCTSTETCNGTISDSAEGKCCVGNCYTPAADTTVTQCGTSINCLISASQTCHLANLTYEFTTSNNTWNQYNKHYYKIRELENDKCVFYQEVIDVSGNFTSAKRTALLGAGNTEEQVNLMEQQLSDVLKSEDTTRICRYSVYSLEEYLTELDEGSYDFTEEDIQKYGCTE